MYSVYKWAEMKDGVGLYIPLTYKPALIIWPFYKDMVQYVQLCISMHHDYVVRTGYVNIHCIVPPDTCILFSKKNCPLIVQLWHYKESKEGDRDSVQLLIKQGNDGVAGMLFRFVKLNQSHCTTK